MTSHPDTPFVPSPKATEKLMDIVLRFPYSELNELKVNVKLSLCFN